MKTPITDDYFTNRIGRLDEGTPASLARRLERDRAALMEALEKIANRHVIAGSTGDYRQGQLDALAACRDVSLVALSAARANFP